MSDTAPTDPVQDPPMDEPQAEDDILQEESPLNFERYENQFALQHKQYMETNFLYLEESDKNFKATFKEMINIEEVNVFFDLETEKNMDDVGFYLNFEEFNAREDPDKVRSLVKECSEILMSNQTNLEVDNKTVDQVVKVLFSEWNYPTLYIHFNLQIQIVVDFFKKIKSDEDRLKKNLKECEENFSFENDDGLKQAIEEVSLYMKKLFKTMSKIRQLKLTFTIPDDRLIGLIDEVPESFSPSLEEIQEMFDEIKLFMSNLGYEFEDLEKQNFEEADEALNRKIVHFADQYLNYLRPSDKSRLESFFVYAYLYRNDRFNEVLNYTSEVLNLMLNKISYYKKAIFLRFFEQKLFVQMKKDIEDLEARSVKILDMNGPIEEFEDLNAKFYTMITAFAFVKSQLVGKKHNEKIFCNPILEVRLPPAMKSLREYEKKMDKVRLELNWIGEYINDLPNYLHASNELKKVEGLLTEKKGKVTMKNMKAAQDILNGFNFERVKAERFFRDVRYQNIELGKEFSRIFERDNIQYNLSRDKVKQVSV